MLEIDKDYKKKVAKQKNKINLIKATKDKLTNYI